MALRLHREIAKDEPIGRVVMESIGHSENAIKNRILFLSTLYTGILFVLLFVFLYAFRCIVHIL